MSPDATQYKRNYYYGSTAELVIGSTLRPEPDRVSSSILDAYLKQGTPTRSHAVIAASTIEQATAIAAIRAYTPSQYQHPEVHVYEVELDPFHVAPLAVRLELDERVAAHKGTTDPPTREIAPILKEYWNPSGPWHVRKVLAPSLTVLREVRPTPYERLYLLRWVFFNKDTVRARSL